jgi:hypothetical protein
MTMLLMSIIPQCVFPVVISIAPAD